ncbi:MAG: alpha/beta hydrolase, partial [Stackebrandtia sp.]
MQKNARKWTVTAVAVLALSVGGVSVWQADAEPASAIDWKPCPEAAEADCATVEVPLDWSKPDGDTIGIGLAR